MGGVGLLGRRQGFQGCLQLLVQLGYAPVACGAGAPPPTPPASPRCPCAACHCLQRGVGVAFGPDVAKRWLEANGLQMVVRSHEVRRAWRLRVEAWGGAAGPPQSAMLAGQPAPAAPPLHATMHLHPHPHPTATHR